MKKLLVYYSYSGNTKKIADMIQEKIDCDVAVLDPVIPYSDDYQTVVDQAEEDIMSNFKPEIKPLNIDINNYDTIILGTPVWWYTYASPVRTFLNKYDLHEKNVIAFATNAGWLGHTIKDIEVLTNVVDSINIKFDEAKLLDEEKVNQWIERIGE